VKAPSGLDYLAEAMRTRPEPGIRNHYLHWAACRAYEEDYTLEEATEALVPAAAERGLTTRESVRTVRSAYETTMVGKPKKKTRGRPELTYDQWAQTDIGRQAIAEGEAYRAKHGITGVDESGALTFETPEHRQRYVGRSDETEEGDGEPWWEDTEETEAEQRKGLPTAIDPAAFHGPLGRYALAASGTSTEASAVAILTVSLSAISALIGRDRWLPLGATRIHPRVWAMLVGETGRGRKGTAHEVSRNLLSGYGLVDNVSGYTQVTQNLKGLNSGEGAEASLIESAMGGDSVSAHLWVGEFATVMNRANREGSTLSTFLRDTYDGMPVSRQTANKKTNGKVQFPHVTIAAGVTPAELRSVTNQTDKDSGFLNRFLVLGVHGTFIDHIPEDDSEEATAAANAIEWALQLMRQEGPRAMRLSRSVEAAYNWWRSENFKATASGAVGGMENRAENHVLSLAMTYAVLDGVLEVDVQHFAAALALWALHEATVRAIWAPAPPPGDHRRVWQFLRAKGDEGMAPSHIKNRLFGAAKASRADGVFAELHDSGWIESYRVRPQSQPRLRARDLRQATSSTSTVLANLRNIRNQT
jgi:hypothetical protein